MHKVSHRINKRGQGLSQSEDANADKDFEDEEREYLEDK